MLRFLFGFLIGAAIGAAAVIVTAPRSGPETRAGIRGLLDDTLEVARQASAEHQQTLWADFRTRLANKGSASRDVI